MIATEELITRAAAFEPSTFNVDRNSVQVVFSTGAGVLRRDFEGDYLEVLDLSAGAVNLDQLRGAPVLDNHNRVAGVTSVLGVVEDASVDGTRGLATLKLSQRPELAGFRQDVQDGIIRAVSVGYSVETVQTSKRSDGVRVKTATRWTPREISFTAMGADPNAKTRTKEVIMDLQTQFRNIATAVGVPMEFADGLATRNATIEDARASMVREAARLLPPIDNRRPAIITRDANDNLVSRMADGLRARFNPSHKPTDGREFASSNMADLARRSLDAAGLSTFGAPAELIQRALTTSDFPLILQEAMNKELFVIKTSPSPITQVFKRATVNDFRNRHILEVSNGSALAEVGESGEITFGTISEAERASYKAKTYGRLHAVSFQTFVNDDMGALADLSTLLVNGARSWFASLLVSTILANPTLNDTYAVFSSQHANLAASGAAPSEATITAAKLAMRVQTDLSGNPVGAAPKFLLHSAALEGTVDKLMATLYPQTPSDAVTSTRALTPIVEPRLDANSLPLPWYLFCDPAEAAVFEYCELSGYEGPMVEIQQGFRTLSTEMRVIWHVGAGAIDSRGAYKNPGA